MLNASPNVSSMSRPAATVDPSRGAALLERAQHLCELCRFPDAATLLSQIIAIDPRHAQAWCLMARAQLGQDRPRAALQAARAAASLACDQEWPRRLESMALVHLGRDEEAADAAQDAVRLAPDRWYGHAQLAHALSHLKPRLDDARAAADQGLVLGPHEAGAHIASGAVAAADGRRMDAIAAFSNALCIDPQNSVAHAELAELRVSKRRLGRPTGRIRDLGRRLRRSEP
jgi:tetratricopeptide (TPR) repeat protein